VKLYDSLDDLYQRHLAHTEQISWNYHNLLPWDLGADFQRHPWAPNQGTLTASLTLAVETALLTEVNLPWFTAGLVRLMDQAPKPLRQFVNTWTAEEDQHARVLEVYLLLTRNGDPAQRNQVRRQVLTQGWDIPSDHPLTVMVYTTLQELATRAFYQNLAQAVKDRDPSLTRILRAIAKDETLHFAFYRDAVKAYIDQNPNRLATVCAAVPHFAMPGTGMPNFDHRMHTIQRQGVYGVSEYLKQVLLPVLATWGIFEHQVGPEAAAERDKLQHYVGRLQRAADRRVKSAVLIP